jgi:hypothetical protein
MFGKFPIVTVRHEPLDYLHWRVLKRGFDIVFSLLVCVLIFSWLFPILAILIKLNSKGPVFLFKNVGEEEVNLSNVLSFGRCVSMRLIWIRQVSLCKQGKMTHELQNWKILKKVKF